MAKQRPATIAEVDKRRNKATRHLRISRRILTLYIKKATIYNNEKPDQGSQDPPEPGNTEELEGGVSARAQSLCDACNTPGQLKKLLISSPSFRSEKLEEEKEAMMTCFQKLLSVHKKNCVMHLNLWVRARKC